MDENKLAENVIESFLEDFHNMHWSDSLLRFREPSVTFQDFRAQKVEGLDDGEPNEAKNTRSVKKKKQGTVDYLSLVVSSAQIDNVLHGY